MPITAMPVIIKTNENQKNKTRLRTPGKSIKNRNHNRHLDLSGSFLFCEYNSD
jgi:hypothetical protein